MNNDLKDLNFINYKNINSLNSNFYFINNNKGFGSGTSETLERIGLLEKDRAVARSLSKVVKPDSYLNCLYTNATSLNDVEKLTDLESRMSQLDNPHLVCVTETWFGNNSAPHIKGYHLHSRCRGRRGGGVCIYVRDDICSMEVMDTQLRGDSDNPNEVKIEQVWCSLKIGEERILVGCIYK